MKKVPERSGKAGLPPGFLVHVGRGEGGRTALHLFEYHAAHLSERTLGSLDEMPADPADGTMNRWLDIGGLHDDTVMRAAAERFNLHPLLVEDILNTDHRPKVEEYQDALFVIAKTLRLDPVNGSVRAGHICFVLRAGTLVSFRENPADNVLDSVRERLRQDLGRARRCGTDYLLYALLDVIVDHYFIVLEELGRLIEGLEAKVVARPGGEDLRAIQRLRGQLIAMARHVTPMRELAGRLNSVQGPLIEKATRRYINDLQDHAVYIAETIGSFREMLGSLENTYHAGVSMRMGQVMKLLTVISTIFIPLTFIVGIYGMNFRHMPELEWRYGYFAVMALMGALALGMLAWFRKRKWL